MQRLLLVYNPRSSRYVDVNHEVLAKARQLKGYIVGKYEVAPTNLDDNINKFAKLLKDGDLVVSAGGDATGIISANGILKSGKDVTLAVLPYGNFNDLARTLGTKTIDDMLRVIHGRVAELGGPPLSSLSEMGEDARTGPVHKITNLYPLEIYIDGKFWRYATCYVTMGMTGEAVELFDEPNTRKKLQKGHKSSWRSYFYLMFWYFKNRHKKQFIPDFKLNGIKQHPKTSDYAAVNGRSMCRVMKGGYDYRDPHIFRSMTDRLTNFWRLTRLMTKSILIRTPGTETKKDTIEFLAPSTVTLQAEGEYHTFKNIKKIEIKKGEKCLKVITT